ncbi:MAG: lipopolysaccharide biosynthesis protein [Proteobacteria bacterium]|nr:lipopolysaccharide biosynthesis protein [Pseudomonadota bacterium]
MLTPERSASTADLHWWSGAVRQLRATTDGLFEPESSQRSASLGALTAFGVRVASAGLLYLSQIVLARFMGSFEYGVYVFVWTWVLVLGGLSSLGLPTLMIRLVPEYRERGEPGLLRGLLYAGRGMAMLAATAIAGLALAALHLFGDHLAHYYVLPVTIALACIPMIALSDVQDGIGRGRGWLATALLPPYVLRPILVLASMLAAHALRLPMTAVTAAGAAVAGTWAAAIAQTWLIETSLRAEPKSVPARLDLGRWLSTSLPLLAITFSELILQNADVLAVSQLMNPHEVGIYFAAAKTMSLVMFVHYAVGSAMANQFAAMNARGDAEGLRQAVRLAVNWTFWPSLAGALAILALGKPLLSLFGPGFAEGWPVMLVLVAGFLGRASMGPSELLLNMLGQQHASARTAIAVALLDVMLCALLVPRFGLLGAAAATALSLLAGALTNTSIAKSRLGLDIAIWQNVGKR